MNKKIDIVYMEDDVRRKQMSMRRNDMVSPEVYAKFEELLHMGQVERAFIKFSDGSVISIGEVTNYGVPGVWQ